MRAAAEPSFLNANLVALPGMICSAMAAPATSTNKPAVVGVVKMPKLIVTTLKVIDGVALPFTVAKAEAVPRERSGGSLIIPMPVDVRPNTGSVVDGAIVTVVVERSVVPVTAKYRSDPGAKLPTMASAAFARIN